MTSARSSQHIAHLCVSFPCCCPCGCCLDTFCSQPSLFITVCSFKLLICTTITCTMMCHERYATVTYWPTAEGRNWIIISYSSGTMACHVYYLQLASFMIIATMRLALSAGQKQALPSPPTSSLLSTYCCQCCHCVHLTTIDRNFRYQVIKCMRSQCTILACMLTACKQVRFVLLYA